MKNNEEIKSWKMASYGFGNFFNEYFTMVFGTFVFFYYETEIGLNVWLTGIGYVIFALWNAVNDPFVGYLTNRPFKFTRKWGRRFPWIYIGGVPYVLSYILIFTPPTTDPQAGAWIIFLWLVFTTCFYDTFASIFWVSFSALFPDKFRTIEQRRKASGLQIPIGIVGVALGAIIPPLLITFKDLNSYVIQAIISSLIGLIGLVLLIPGAHEDQALVDRYLETHSDKEEKTPFMKSLRNTVKQRSFVAFIFLYTMYSTVIGIMSASIPYVIAYVLGMPASAATLLFAGFLIGGLIAIPIWIKMAHKTDNNKKIILSAGILLGVFTLPLIFLENYVLMIIVMVIWGTALGGFWVMIAPVIADVIDESIVRNEKREEGVITGFQRFFARSSLIIQAMTFAIVHTLTGFEEDSPTQIPSAVWGIHVHLAVVPAIAIFIGCLIFWKWYDLTPDRIKANQERIKELGL